MRLIDEISNNYNKLNTHTKTRVSYKDKIANDFQWVKDKVNFYERFHNTLTERKKSLAINYDLYNGQYEESNYDYLFKNFGFETDLRNASFKHFDIMSEPLREIVGEEERRPFEPMAMSVNADAAIKRRQEKAKLIQEYIYNQAIAPILEKAKNIPEEQREQYLKEMTPPEIEEFIKKKFKSPEETKTQRLLNWLVKKEIVQHKFNRGWKDVIIGAQETYYVTTENGHPVLNLINPKNFTSDASQDVLFIEDGEWASYEAYLTISDAYKKYGEYFTEKDRKALDGYNNEELMNLDKTQSMIEGTLLESGGIVYDVTTFQRYIRTVHVAFKALKKIKFLTTNTENGIEEVIVDETYKFNPEFDVSETVAYIDEVWEGTKLGKDIYVKLGPIKNQYTSMTNPQNVKLPYYGAIYENRNSNPVSLLDRAKAWNYMFDVAFYRLEETIGSDLGNIMVTLQKSIPKNWSPEKWLAFLKATKIALIDPTQDGIGSGTDPQYWKSINVSNNADISKYLNLLSYCQEQCYKSIGTNSNRIGSAAASETVGNNQQKLIQSANITEPIFSLHNIVKERVCTALIQEAILAYKGRKEEVTYILDDMSIELLNLNTDDLALSEIGIFITNSVEDHNMLQTLRANVNLLIQNSGGDLRIVATALRTKNPAVLEELIHSKYEEMQEQQAAQAQQGQQLEQAKIQMELEQRQLDRDNAIKIATIKALGETNNNDINKNQIPDLLEMHKFNKEYEIKLKELELRKKTAEENNKSEAADREVEREKIEVMKKKNNLAKKE